MDLLIQSHEAILKTFQNHPSHPHRFIYAVAGRLFYVAAPIPFGGPRTSPGYADFDGESPEELLAFILASSFKVYWNSRGRMAVDAIIEAVNTVLEWHVLGLKDELDELVLKGMKKAGHIEWFGSMNIPPHLVYEMESQDQKGAYFTARRRHKNVAYTPNVE